MLFAARSHEAEAFPGAGLPELELHGLERDPARELLQTRVDVEPRVADRLIEITRGNPLALLELPTVLTERQLAGREPLEDPLPVGKQIEASFLSRVRSLSPAAQTTLLVAAAADTGDVATTLDAAASLEAPAHALEEAERERLIAIDDGRFAFTHPLVRSAVYQAAEASARRATHRALAHALQGRGRSDRRAWHLAAAALGADEEAAGALVEAAADAELRTGLVEAAHANERAARLTSDPSLRAEQLLKASRRLRSAGEARRAQTLLAEIAESAHDPEIRADIQLQRASLEMHVGDPVVAHRLFVEEAARMEAVDRPRAALLYVLSANFHLFQLDAVAAVETARKAWEIGKDDLETTEVGRLELPLRLLLGTALTLHGETEEALPHVHRCADICEADPRKEQVRVVVSALSLVEEFQRARRLAEAGVQLDRETGAHVGRQQDARGVLGTFEEQARQTGRTWALAAAARCRGLLVSEGFDTEFATALEWHSRKQIPFERARTELCYGERLRRAGRRVEARERLQAALATFEQLSASPWVERARAELVASGETIRKRKPETREELTPQEVQVAAAVAGGMSNKEAAAALFLSAKTIEFHLGNAYRKLGVRSRTQLANVLARQAA